MAQDLERIRRYISALVRRERALVLGSVLLYLLLVGLALVVGALVAAAARVDHASAIASLVFLAGAGTWVALLPLWSGWSRAGDALRQARLVEALDPELRGRLVTAVDGSRDPQPQRSDALFALVASRAAERAGTVKPGHVHRARRVFGLFLLTGFLWVLSVPTAFLLPGGPSGAFTWWTSGAMAEAAVADLHMGADKETAWVGDLILRYTYPEYTGLEAREIPNSTGDVTGPPGTRVDVIARADERIEAAALVAYDEPALDAVVSEQGRKVSGSFTIQVEPGTYHLVLYRRGEPTPSRDFEIAPEPDLPPEVTLDVDQEVIELSVDESMQFLWRARDDYGVAGVGLNIDGRQVQTLERPSTRVAELSDHLYTRPRDLGLRPGDEVMLQVTAWDNDSYSGSKAGESEPVKLIVLGPQGVQARAMERQEELRDLMLDILADYLEEPWPPEPETTARLASWGEDVAHRYEPLEDIVEAWWEGFEPNSIEGRAAYDVLDSGQKLIRYTQVAFDARSNAAPKESAVTITADLRDHSITMLEESILLLDRLLQMQAMAEIARQVDVLEQISSQLEELLEQDADAGELLSRLDQLERMYEQMQRQAARLSEGGIKEFVNQRADESQSLMEEIRKAIAEGRMDEAKKLMERLTEQLREMGEGIRENMERNQGESKNGMDEAKELIDELKALEEKQRDLQQQVQAAREKGDADASKRAADLWKKVKQKVAEAKESAGEYREGLDENERAFYEQQRAEMTISDLENLQDATGARDLSGARNALDDAQRSLQRQESTYYSEKMGRGELPGPGSRELSEMSRDLAELQRIMDQLEQASREIDPQVMEQTRALEQQQRDLQGELDHLRDKAQQVSRDLPIQPRNLDESIQEGGKRMEQAGQQLGGGDPMQAEGSQGAAAERVKEARQSLEDVMQQMQQMQQQMQQGGQGDQQGKEQGQKGDGRRQSQPLPLPIPEDQMTPEEYRELLLEGMEGDVPEEYRALKKRYYEELVNL